MICSASVRRGLVVKERPRNRAYFLHLLFVETPLCVNKVML